MRRSLWLVTGMAVALPTLVNATVFVIGPSHVGGIQDVIDNQVTQNTDVIELQPGTYTGAGNAEVDYHGWRITIRSQSGPATCIIDCLGFNWGFAVHSGETSVATLERVTVRNATQWGVTCDESSALTIRGCVLENNSTGVHSVNEGSASLEDCTMRDNSGGLSVTQASAQASGCYFCNNQTAVGVDNASVGLQTSVLVGNHAGISGSLASVSLTHCTVSGNDIGVSGFRIICRFDRSILWGDCTEATVEGGSGRLDFLCSDVDPSSVTCDTCEQPPDFDPDTVFLDPLFCDPRACTVAPTCDGDYHLHADSPCTSSNSLCGDLIGALGVGCGATPVEIRSWGGIKLLYRE